MGIAERITDFAAHPVQYHAPEGLCRATNVTFAFDGRRHSSRFPHVRPREEALRLTVKSLTLREERLKALDRPPSLP